MYKKEVEYCDGDTCMLELLCLPGVVEPEDAKNSLTALHDSILWLYLSCGPEATKHDAERKEMYTLVRQREDLKIANGDAAALGSSEIFFTFFEAAGGAYYEGSAAERAAAAGGNPETFEA